MGVLDMLLGGGQPIGTPGINPAAPDPRMKTPSKLDSFLGTPGGGLLMNLLAQSGYSTTPSSPLGAVGRGLQATQAQQQQQARSGLEDELLRSQIGLNSAKTVGALTPGQGNPLTDLAKLRADLSGGRISREDFDVRRKQIIGQDLDNRFDRTTALREEFSRETKGLQSSLQALAAARSLANEANPTAQLASFISTIRSIDNSTVREGELAAFREIQSLATKLDELQKKAGDGGFSETLLGDIDSTITALETPLTQLLGKKQNFYRGEASNFEINPDSVAGLPFPTVGPSTRQQRGQGQVLPPAAVDGEPEGIF